MRGNPKAPVTIVEFSDFQCPYCVRARPTVARVREVYGDQVRFAFRHFPLDFHPQAQKAGRGGGLRRRAGQASGRCTTGSGTNTAKLQVPDLKAHAAGARPRRGGLRAVPRLGPPRAPRRERPRRPARATASRARRRSSSTAGRSSARSRSRRSQQVIDDELARRAARHPRRLEVTGPTAAPPGCASRSASRRSRRPGSPTRAIPTTASATRSCGGSRSRWRRAASPCPRTRSRVAFASGARLPDAEGGRARRRLPRRRAAARARAAQRPLDVPRRLGRRRRHAVAAPPSARRSRRAATASRREAARAARQVAPRAPAVARLHVQSADRLPARGRRAGHQPRDRRRGLLRPRRAARRSTSTARPPARSSSPGPTTTTRRARRTSTEPPLTESGAAPNAEGPWSTLQIGWRAAGLLVRSQRERREVRCRGRSSPRSRRASGSSRCGR